MNDTQNSANLKSKLGSLYAYMSRRLHIKNTPKLKLTNDFENSKKSFGVTGYYEPASQLVNIFITERHPTDILRSFAHEIVHHWQNERGQLKSVSSSQYTQKDLHMRKKEMEAYLLGNILFRDWQDEKRYGSPKKAPMLVSLD
jgi:hypothetical protein